MIKKLFFISMVLMQSLQVQAISITELRELASQEEQNAKNTFNISSFQIKDIHGETHTASSFHGKPMILNFWASWSPSSNESMTNLSIFYKNNSDKIQAVGMNYEYMDETSVLKIVEEKQITFPVALLNSTNRPQFNSFEPISVIPTTFIFDSNGSLLEIYEDELTVDFLNKFIN